MARRKTVKRRRNPARALLVGNPKRRRRKNPRRRRKAPVYRVRRRAPVRRRRSNPKRRRAARRRTASPRIIYMRPNPVKRRVRRYRRRKNPGVADFVGMALSAGAGFMVMEYATNKVMQFFPTLYQYPFLKPIVEGLGAFGLYKYGPKILPSNIARAAAVGAGAAAAKAAIDMILGGNLFGGILGGNTAVTQGALMSPGMGALMSPQEGYAMGQLMDSDLNALYGQDVQPEYVAF